MGWRWETNLVKGDISFGEELFSILEYLVLGGSLLLSSEYLPEWRCRLPSSRERVYSGISGSVHPGKKKRTSPGWGGIYQLVSGGVALLRIVHC